MNSNAFSLIRLIALCKKEFYQIIRDPSSALIAFILPMLLLFIFGYGINLDSSRLRIGLLVEHESKPAAEFRQTMLASPYIQTIIGHNRQELIEKIEAGTIRGIIVIPDDFADKLARPGDIAPIQVITDGSEPNTANFVQAYANGVWLTWLQKQAQDQGVSARNLIEIEQRYWFNSAAISRNFIIPGAITIIMTVIGSLLTSLVIAREWERGTMEALLSTQITRAELLIAKLIPYYILGMIAMLVCMLVATFVMQVPFRGSLILLFGISSLFLASILGFGLLISTITRNQFNAAQIALNAGFLPAVMLSGFIFEIHSMPIPVQLATYLIPGRYFVNTLQTLFLAGNIMPILITNILFLFGSAVLFIGLTFKKTRRQLD